MIAQSGRSRYWKLRLGSALIIAGAIASGGNLTLAQIIPDVTLGAESSVVTPNVDINGLPSDRIDGGAIRGTNLFHSFEQFSVLTGREAFFNNATDIQNIISRVTGASISNIDGLIGSNGTANLFLLNPNGIIFGPNASLSIGGSFVGSTASSVNFTDGSVFSATAPQPTPLLTVSVPVGLQFGETRGSIAHSATNSNGQRVGLQVQPGETLALLGGDVRLDGGNLFAPGGRVELGGVAEPGTVGLNVDSNNLSLSFPAEVRRADIFLTNGSQLNVSAIGGGSIALNARSLDVSGASSLDANRESGPDSLNTQAGDITLNATEAITIANDSTITSEVRPGAVGNGGSINIIAGSVSVTNGAQLAARTRGQGNGGSVTINARDTVLFEGVGNRVSAAYSGVVQGVGKGGSISITSGSLYVRNGAQLGANTSGQGNAGRITILARDQVNFDGVGSNGGASGAFSRVESTGVGNGGNIDITTGSLSLTNAAFLVVSTLGQGDGGSVTINARDTVLVEGVTSNGFSGGVLSRVLRDAVGNAGDINVTTGSLFATNGARLNAESLGQGNAGSVTINARDTVFLDGVGSNGNFSGVFGAVLLPNNSRINQSSPGQGGNLTIKTGQLIVQNNAEVNVTSERLGSAGEIRVEADSIELNDRGKLQAEALLSQGGNINLQVRDLILMRRQGLISATAGGTGNGGNVTIGNATNAPLIVAFSAEDSDIIAQANEGQGGNINIFTQGIFGLEARNPTTPQTSDINASSEVGIDGTVEINTLNVDPSQGLTELPEAPVNVEVAQGCQTVGKQASIEFFNTGRGGLAPNPYEPISSSHIWEDVPTSILRAENSTGAASPSTPPATPPDKIVEAQEWLMNEKGEVILVAEMPTTRPQAGCRLH